MVNKALIEMKKTTINNPSANKPLNFNFHITFFVFRFVCECLSWKFVVVFLNYYYSFDGVA